MADSALAIKLLNDPCLECSICAIFFNSSFTVSINARFRNRNYQVQLEPEKPSHGTHFTKDQAFKGFVILYNEI